MADPTFLQLVVHEAVEVFDFIGDWLGEDAARKAIAKDLGGTPTSTPDVIEFKLPEAPMASIKAYRVAGEKDLTAEADAAVVADILQIIDFVRGNIEVIRASGNFSQAADEFVNSALDLVALNYVRLRWPRLFLILQAVNTIEEATSTYGAGDNSLCRLGTALWTVVKFLFNPGRGLEQLEPGADPNLPDVAEDYGYNHRTVDGLLRLGAAVLGWLHGNQKWKDITGDLVTGWDAPGLDIDSTAPPQAGDVMANTMVSFSFYPQDDEFEGAAETAKPLFLSLAWVPAFLKEQGAFVSFGGYLEKEVEVGEKWLFSAKIRSEAGVAVLIKGLRLRVLSSLGDDALDESNFQASLGFASQPDPASGLSFSIPRPTGTRLDIGQVAWSASLTKERGAETTVSLINAVFVVDGSDNDSFIRKLLGGKPLRQAFNLTLGYGSGRGLILEGGPIANNQASGTAPVPLAGDGPVGGSVIDVTIPVGRRIGPVTILEVPLRIEKCASVPDGEPNAFAVTAAVSFSVSAGPIYFRADRLGLGLKIDTSKPPEQSNLRVIDARLSVAPPLGIALSIDTKLVSGGGAIFFDPATGNYFGALSLRLGKFTLKAFGLVATKRADGTPGSSFIIFATLEGLGWQIGPVTVDGLGLLLASDRTFDEVAMRAALPTGQLKSLLFPSDPLHQTTEILRSLSTFFPALERSLLIGILVKLLFGRTELVRLDLACILQWRDGGNAPDRLIVLGRLSSIIPTEKVRAVQLNLDAVGVFDFSSGLVALDAVLSDSKLCGRFPLTGAAAFRRVPGVSGFALAVGGFHPRFAAPPGFPALPRITVALTNGNNPKLILQGYVAITANTVQLGADAALSASACGFSLEGNVGFDVLIQLIPPHFLAEFRASVQLKRGSSNLFKVAVEGLLEGPYPLRVAGKATFEILWWDYSVSFDKTLIGSESPPVVINPVDVEAEVILALSDRRAWRSELPTGADRMVALRRDERPDQILVHPMGTLQVQQGVAPLNHASGIDRLGEARLKGARGFELKNVKLGKSSQTPNPVLDQFAPGQLFDLTDDQRIVEPSFKEMQAGVTFGDDSYDFARSALLRSASDYTDLAIGNDGVLVEQPHPTPSNAGLVLTLAGFGAAARASLREASTRFKVATSPRAPVLLSSGGKP